MLVCVDLGHVGRTGGSPPARHHGLREDLLVIEYGRRAAEHLLAGGVEVAVMGHGPYAARRVWARDQGADVYLALHCNAAPDDAPQDYGLVLWGEAEGSESLARAVGGRLRQMQYGPTRVLVQPAGPPWPTATATLTDVEDVPAVLLEPGFLTASAHRELWTPEGLRELGHAIAAGVLSWRR